MGKRFNPGQLIQATDGDLAAIIVGELATLDGQGVRLPDGWRGRASDLGYLDTLLTEALRQLKAG